MNRRAFLKMLGLLPVAPTVFSFGTGVWMPSTSIVEFRWDKQGPVGADYMTLAKWAKMHPMNGYTAHIGKLMQKANDGLMEIVYKPMIEATERELSFEGVPLTLNPFMD